MIRSFRDRATEDVFHGDDTKAARKAIPSALHGVARRRLDSLNAANSLMALNGIPGNELHALKRDRAGQHAIRISGKYRICFVWTDQGPVQVEITDYH